MKRLIIGILLFIIAVFFTAVFTIVTLPLNWLYYAALFRWNSGVKKIADYFHQCALSVDQFANVSLQNAMNVTMTTGDKFHKFGDEDDTLSYVIAMNRKNGTLSRFGSFWAWFLDTVDKGHLEKAINNKRQRDQQAWSRIEVEHL